MNIGFDDTTATLVPTVAFQYPDEGDAPTPVVRDLLREALLARRRDGITITIGAEHQDERLSAFTLVTSSYRSGPLSGVIGILGPTRMPYDKVVALVDHTSRLVGDLLQ